LFKSRTHFLFRRIYFLALLFPTFCVDEVMIDTLYNPTLNLQKRFLIYLGMAALLSDN